MERMSIYEKVEKIRKYADRGKYEEALELLQGVDKSKIKLLTDLGAIADVYDALVNKRVYKDAYPASTAFAMIINGECGSFSNNVLQSFTRARKSFENVLNEIPYSE